MTIIFFTPRVLVSRRTPRALISRRIKNFLKAKICEIAEEGVAGEENDDSNKSIDDDVLSFLGFFFFSSRCDIVVPTE